jgi:copper transport protein
MKFIRRLPKSGGVALLLICIVMLLAACSSGGVTQTPTPTESTAFHDTLKTTDGQFMLQLSVTPNRLGLNVFTVSVEDVSTGKPLSGVQVQLATTMLDMDMGTDRVVLQSKGNGQYSAQGTLSMEGHWQIRILLRTPDSALHEASVEFDTAS